MNVILFDTALRSNLFPLTLTKAVADFTFGILSIKERWQKLLSAQIFVLTEEYLQDLYPHIEGGNYIFIDAAVIPTTELVEAVINLGNNESIIDEHGLIAARKSIDPKPSIDNIYSHSTTSTSITKAKRLSSPADIFLINDQMIRFDFSLVTKNLTSQMIADTVHTKEASQIFIEQGTSIDYSILNASTGPIYIGRNAVVMEGCMIRGPFCLGEGATLKMSTRIYGATTIGPYCTAGGEIKNSVMMGYSNKGHDGYLGDSVIGGWCNMGAGTSNSNVKNNASEVKLWNYKQQQFLSIGVKCGVIMGDYSRTAINTSINTGTVIGVCCNLFGEGLTPKFIDDYSWGTSGELYEFEKAIQDVDNWKKMKNKRISEPETKVLKHIFDSHNK
jgi:UDP-N-acetylglucosamine diphosphorylase/glucosamine-1-phosphate N-acetyltransferase